MTRFSHTIARLPRILLILALLAPLTLPLSLRADGLLDAVVRQALADIGLPAPLPDDAALEAVWADMQKEPERLHAFCVAETSTPDASEVTVSCQRRIGQLRPELGEDVGYVCGYSLNAQLLDLRQIEDADPDMVSQLLQVAREGWGSVPEVSNTAEISEVTFVGGTIHSNAVRPRPREQGRASIWSDGDVVIMANSKEEAFLNISNDPSTLPCTLEAFRSGPSTEDLIIALYRAAAGAGLLESDAALIGVPDPTPTPAADHLEASCELGFNRNAPLLLYVNTTFDGEPLSHEQLTVRPSGEWEGAQWADLLRLYDDGRADFVNGETGTRTNGEGQARLAAKLLYDEAPQPILRGQPIRGAFTISAPGLSTDPDSLPLETRCEVALDYVAVGHEPAWGPLLVFPLGEDEPAIAVRPGEYRTGDFPLYMGDRVVLGHDEQWGSMGDRPGAGARLLLTYVDGTRAEFRIETLQDERLEVREGDVWHPARAEFMIGRALPGALERDWAGAISWAAFMLGAFNTESLIQQKIYAVVVASGPVGWKAHAITWVIMTTGKKALAAMVIEPDIEDGATQCLPGRLFVPSRYGDVRLREPCGQRVGFEMQVRSVVELEVGAEGTTVRTHAGDPAVRDVTGNLQPVPPGQELHIDDADRAGVPVPFEPQAPWWDPDLMAPLGQTSTEGAYIWPVADDLHQVADLGADMDGGLLLWIAGICGCGLSLLVLLGGLLLLTRRRRRSVDDDVASSAPLASSPRVPSQVPPGGQTNTATPSNADAWWVAEGGQPARGPYTWAQLQAAARKGTLDHSYWVYDPQTHQWVPAWHYRELIS